jgi:hypothetical protein
MKWENVKSDYDMWLDTDELVSIQKGWKKLFGQHRNSDNALCSYLTGHSIRRILEARCFQLVGNGRELISCTGGTN